MGGSAVHGGIKFTRSFRFFVGAVGKSGSWASIASSTLTRWYAGSFLRSFSTSLAKRIRYTPVGLHMRVNLSNREDS